MTNSPAKDLPSHGYPVLIVEDSDEDFEAFCRGWSKSGINNPLYRCDNGDDVLDFLLNHGKYADRKLYPRPGLILLDLNLPGTDGREVLAEIKRENDLKKIPVVIFTTSANPKDLEICYQNGANSYIIKPINAVALMDTIKVLGQYWFKRNQPPVEVLHDCNDNQRIDKLF
jgi:CheY-like chemotaxis protein